MFLFRKGKTRGPILGILIITVFIALGASLLMSVNNRGGEVEAGTDGNLPNVVNQVEERDEFFVSVENQTIRINASSPNERVHIYNPPPTPLPIVIEVQPEVLPAEGAEQQEVPTLAPPPTATPIPLDPEVIVVEVTTTFGEDQAAADLVPTATPPLPVVIADTNYLIAYTNHTVSAGETIYQLTRLYNTSVTMLSEAGISEADMLPGNLLNIPYANNGACASGRAYPIREGDTLFRIGVNHGTTAAILQQVNGVDASYSIDAGGAICLP